jgi:enoyl-CoA hydratase
VAQELGTVIAANGPLAIATTKQVIMESADWPTRDMFELQRALTGPVFTSADAREGAVAFAEKRKPVWTGK